MSDFLPLWAKGAFIVAGEEAAVTVLIVGIKVHCNSFCPASCSFASLPFVLLYYVISKGALQGHSQDKQKPPTEAPLSKKRKTAVSNCFLVFSCSFPFCTAVPFVTHSRLVLLLLPHLLLFMIHFLLLLTCRFLLLLAGWLLLPQ